jgi:hypothetical protein
MKHIIMMECPADLLSLARLNAKVLIKNYTPTAKILATHYAAILHITFSFL